MRRGGLALLLAAGIGAGPPGGLREAAADGEFDHGHTGLDSLLAKHVVQGRVDYRGLIEERASLQGYLATLATLGRDKLEAFTREEQLALYINAYNAFTVEVILRHYPVASILDIEKAWDGPRLVLAGERYTLNEIEHELLRNQFAEPRIHFAVVCAAAGCPPLRSEAYRADRLEEQLSEATRHFVRTSSFNRLDRVGGVLYVSKIFEWYGEDFEDLWGESRVPPGSDRSRRHRALVGFFRDQLPADAAEHLRTEPVRIHTLKYDWALNERRPE